MLELGKTLYSVFVLHTRHFQSMVGLWFFISSEVFHVNSGIIVSLSLSLLFDFVFNFRCH